MLPDVVDQMDRGQLLAVAATHALLRRISRRAGKRWDPIPVLCSASTERHDAEIDALIRISLDRLKRKCVEIREAAFEDHQVFNAMVAETIAAIEGMPSCGPYTLGGAMPNVTAGRVANVFNLNGPALVLDAEGRSLYEALAHAERQLRSQTCRMVIAGAIQRVGRTRRPADRVVAGKRGPAADR